MILACDAAGLEWRTLIEWSRDKVALQEILEKQDIHTNNQNAFNLPSRLISKKYLFRTIYNRGQGYAFTLDPEFMDVSTSVAYWDEVGQKFYKKYAGIDACHIRWQQEAMTTGTINSPWGISWVIPFNPTKIPWTILTNYPNQGLGALVMSLVRVSFKRRLAKKDYAQHVKLISTVHDSVVTDVPSSCVQDVTDLFSQCFDDLDKNFKKCYNYDWLVPLECECKFGPNQKDLQKILRKDK